MASINLGRVRGSMWYAGSAITGNNSAGAVFGSSGITRAYVNDMYLNTNSVSDYSGNIYMCIKGGSQYEAEWAFIGNIKGNMPTLVDNLVSQSTITALTANAGRRLNEKIENANIYPTSVVVDCSTKAYTLVMSIDNVNTTITIKDASGRTGTYNYTKAGTDEKATLNIPISSTIGLSGGAVIKAISSSAAKIYSYTLLNSSSATIKTVTPKVWDEIYNILGDIEMSTEISEENAQGNTVTYNTANVSKVVDGNRREFMPITHAKATWFNKSQNQTVYERIAGDITENEIKNMTW